MSLKIHLNSTNLDDFENSFIAYNIRVHKKLKPNMLLQIACSTFRL